MSAYNDDEYLMAYTPDTLERILDGGCLVASDAYDVLGSNLVIAGALCRSFELGHDAGYADAAADSCGCFRGTCWGAEWNPGCERTVP